MNRSTGLLRAYTTLIRRVSGAISASLFVPSRGEQKPILLFEGEPVVAELENIAKAEAWSQSRRDVVTQTMASRHYHRDTSESPHGWLVAVSCGPTPSDLIRGTEATTPRRRVDDGSDPLPASVCWIGVRFTDDARGRAQSTEALRLLTSDNEMAENPEGWPSLITLAGVLAWYAGQISSILDDPVTGLSGRAEFQASLSHAIDLATEIDRPLSLLFVNPDDFTAVNEQHGHEAGDRVLREIGTRLRRSHRTSDTIAKYGGAIFATFLKDSDLDAARTVAAKVWSGLSEKPYLGGSVRLGVSIGLSVFDPNDPGISGHLELIRRADKALNAAKRFGGDCIVAWEPELEATDIGNVDRMTGVYTGHMAKDYRNMTLLSDTMTVVAGSADVGELAERVIERLYATLKADHVGIFESRNGETALLKGVTKRANGTGKHKPTDGLELGPRQRALLENALREQRVAHVSWIDEYSEQEVLAFAAPMTLSSHCLGCLYLDGRADTLDLEGSSDLGFLHAFATQLAVALDRARLGELRKQQSEQEQLRLREEVSDLRASLPQTQIVYQSREIGAVLDTVRRVAPTKATVLVIGESGTGKELIARKIHELSPFHRKPVIVVDCGAIPTTLIESELFGHERGAYTGAQERRVGRLLEAEGGTVILDEIGELPLEVQSKLLRFVQERQLTPVGGAKTRRVDTRLVAVTNRELAVEAAAGRFREDLYYRLNVVRITVPPLRDHPDDILHLADHFLDRFSRQYRKDTLRLDEAAKASMLDYAWPGNVRELQNRIMQAVILCEGSELGVAELGLETLPTGQTVEMDLSMMGPGAVQVARSLSGGTADSSAETGRGPEESWAALRTGLQRQIEIAIQDPSGQPVPLGTWLLEDLVLHAYQAGGSVSGRARALLGIPETTFRRRLRKATSKARAELLARKPQWSSLTPTIAALVRARDVANEDVLQRARQILLEEVVKRTHDASAGAALMGVTVRTFRRWTSELDASLGDHSYASAIS